MSVLDQRLILLRRVVALRRAVEEMIRTGRRLADDAYGEQYNSLCIWANTLFEGHDAIDRKMQEMPDAVTQLNPNAGTHRLLARLSYLETQMSLILGVDPNTLLEAHMSSGDTTNPEAQRDAILRRIFENEQTGTSEYLKAEKLAEQTGLSPKDVVFHLGVLERQGYLDLTTAMGKFNVGARLTTLGEQRVREGVRGSAGITIGAIIGTMTGGNVQAVGSAVNSDVSQVVNDPRLLREALDSLGNQLVNAVKADLPPQDLTAYVQAVEAFKAEMQGRRDPSTIQRLLKILSFAGDIEGSLALTARVAPFIAAAMSLLQGLGLA